MTGFLVDTNVIPEFIKPQPDARVISWLEAVDPDSLFASVITLGEIRLGIEDLALGKRRAGATVTTADGLLAATALERDLAIVTRNTKDPA